MATHFQPAALKFLSSLARNNDRDWFNARKATYEKELKAPLLALIEAINHAMVDFAPDHLRAPNKAMMRIYRDTRFAKDKRPYKHQVAAWWPRHGMEKKEGGGFYFHIHPKEVHVFAGVFMPESAELLAIRRWMAEHHEEYRALLKPLLKARGKAAPFVQIEANALTRMPKGFASDHPADELLRAKNWGVSIALPVELVTSPNLAKEISAKFRATSPLVHMLNGAILAGERVVRPSANEEERRPRKPLF